MKLFKLLLLLALCSSSVQPVDYNDKLVQQKLINYFAILTGPILGSATQLIFNYVNDPVSNPLIPTVDEQTAQIIRERLAQAGVKNAHEIEIKRVFSAGISDNAFAYKKGFSGYRIVLTTVNTYHELEIIIAAYLKALESDDKEEISKAKEALDQALWVIDHEAQHIINDDVNYRFLVKCAIHAGLFGINELWQSKPIAERSNANLLATALSQVILGSYLSAKYNRYTELRADKGIENNATTLKGAITFFNKNHNDIENYITSVIANNAHCAPWVQKLLYTLSRFNFYGPYRSHPNPLHRVKILEDRLEQIT